MQIGPDHVPSFASHALWNTVFDRVKIQLMNDFLIELREFIIREQAKFKDLVERSGATLQ